MKLSNNLVFENIIKKYEEQARCTFDSQQIEELRAGYESSLHIEAYADPIISYTMMFAIRRAIEERRTYLSNAKAQRRFAVYVYDEFDELQLDELAIGLSKGVDIEKYAMKCLNHEEMYLIRRGLEVGIDTAELVYNGHELHEIHQMLGVDNYYYEIEE